MKCSQMEQIIPRVLRRELGSEEHLEAISHLRRCHTCRTLYFQYQNIFYSIDRNTVRPAQQEDTKLVETNVLKRIGLQKDKSQHRPVRYYLYATAAVLIVFTIFYGLLPRMQQNKHTETQTANPSTLKQYLYTGDWKTLNAILQDPQKVNLYIDEKIPLNLLRAKLTDLKESGIETIHYRGPATESENPDIKIRLIELLTSLNQYRQESNVSLRELSMFL